MLFSTIQPAHLVSKHEAQRIEIYSTRVHFFRFTPKGGAEIRFAEKFVGDEHLRTHQIMMTSFEKVQYILS